MKFSIFLFLTTLTGLDITRQRIHVKFKAKIVNLWIEWYLNAIKTRKTWKSTAFTKSFLNLHYQPLSNVLWFYWNDSILNATFSAFIKITDTFNKNERCHMTLEWLSSVCARSEPASSKNNEILEMNVLQKFTSHALFCRTFYFQDFINFLTSWL